nr:RNA-directed DNA polymerase, eukaryota, reverse transcriptase zinc-binding domain protein [Tanacetum cinerariifolium]
AVWECGLNKSSGPDGFSFDFFQKYWKLIDVNVVATVQEFFVTSKFPRGCNSSFIALIPKVQDAKVVKDFRPISLIGSMYKIFAKVLANRLSIVIPNLISEVQSSFVSNRQILDGSSILNEFLSWCKYKNTKAFIFKVNFEKAFDSVKWDYLDDTLKAFCFGEKWRGWIDGCLKSAMGSILVNGSPTSEFEFKECFFLASGLKINLHKSKLMGIGVNSQIVSNVANTIGCSTFSTPFNYHGVKVGDIMSRGSLDKVATVTRTSPWLDILREVSSLKSKAIDLLNYARIKVGNKANTMFWEDLWVGDSTLKMQYPRLYSLELQKDINVAEKLGHSSLVFSFRGHPRGGTEEEQLHSLLSSVVRRWWLMADEDEGGGEVEGDGGMEIAADVMVADKDGGDVVFE